jgi:hypothetical protein
LASAEAAREQASPLRPSKECESLLSKARRADTAANTDAWVSSPDLQPPESAPAIICWSPVRSRNRGACATFLSSRCVEIARWRDRLEQRRASNDGPALALRRNFPAVSCLIGNALEETKMDGIVYLVGLIVIIMFILSLFGLR